MAVKIKKIKENIEYMLWVGMTIGEIQVVYPHVSTSIIRNIGKEIDIEISTSKRTEKLKTRDTAVIQKLLTNLLETETLENPEKVKLVIERIGEIDTTSRRHRFKKDLIQKAREGNKENRRVTSLASNKEMKKKEERGKD